MLLGQSTQRTDTTLLNDWIVAHQHRLRQCHHLAEQQLRKAQNSRQQRNKQRVYQPQIKLGDHVYLRNRPQGRHKIQDYWSPQLYTVVGVPAADSPNQIFSIQPESPVDNPVVKVVHRLNIRKCGPHQQTTRTTAPVVEISQQITDSESDSEDEVVMVTFLPASSTPQTLQPNISASQTLQPNRSASQTRQPTSSAPQSQPASGSSAESIQHPTPSTAQCPAAEIIPPAAPMPAELPPQTRRSTRATAGKHSNPHRIPQTAIIQQLSAGNLSVPAERTFCLTDIFQFVFLLFLTIMFKVILA